MTGHTDKIRQKYTLALYCCAIRQIDILPSVLSVVKIKSLSHVLCIVN